MTRADPTILIVEDDPEISAPLAAFLDGKGYSTRVAASTKAAEETIARDDVDLILLDVMLPGETGLDFCRRLPLRNRPRIIMLTALSESMDKVLGLELGADDYVTKPFDLRELLARIRAVLRRPSAAEAAPLDLTASVRFSGFSFLPYRRLLHSPKGTRIVLTGSEADLLLVLCQHPRQVLSREELIGLTRGDGHPISTRSIDLLVSRLRRKLSGNNPLDDVIHTVRADGYVLQSDVDTD